MTLMRRGWFHLASGAGIGRVIGFVGNLLLSRWLGPTDLGLFNLVATTVQTSDTLVRCGGDYALNYELGGQPEAVQTERGVQLTSALVQLCTSTTLIVCFGLAIWIWFGQGLFPLLLSGNQRISMTLLLLSMQQLLLVLGHFSLFSLNFALVTFEMLHFSLMIGPQ